MRSAFLVGLAALVASACIEKEAIIRQERTPRTFELECAKLLRDRRGMVARIELPRPICEPGQLKACAGPSPSRLGPLMMHCIRGSNGAYQWNRGDCSTPIVLATEEPVAFTRPALTDHGILALDLNETRPNVTTPGSYEGERASVTTKSAGRTLRLVDVYLSPLD